MTRIHEGLEARVVDIVSEALAVPASDIHPHSSLIDDLGAESIDFLDILFRLETAFGIKIPEDELWKGSIDPSNPASIEAGLVELRRRMPAFRWDRLPARMTREHLPRLITVQTIVDYFSQRQAGRPSRPEVAPQ